jgi:hypothetical protein
MKITDEMKIGWNACRRQVYLLAEHEQDSGPYAAEVGDFARGYKYMAKSFAKAFNAFEAADCDFLNAAALEAALPHITEEQEPVAWIANCRHCGRVVDTRERHEGGDKHGVEVDNGTWVCSPACWDAVVEGAAHPSTELERLREENERQRKALERVRDETGRCEHDGGFDREIGPIGCSLGDKCVCIGIHPIACAGLSDPVATLRTRCAASGYHDHDGCDCSDDLLRTRALSEAKR